MGSGDLVQTDVETLLSFEPQDNPNGLAIIDHIERRRCTLETGHPVDPQAASTDSFYFPVDRGVSITTDRLTLPHTVAVCLRNHAGFMIEELTQGDTREFPGDLYSIELSAPVKLYVVVEAAPAVSVTTEKVTISFDEMVEIRIGARSHHKHPAAILETTADPNQMMEAVSYLGSALKTTSVERSYPTLRGHPPTIELGETTRIPDILQKPETGISLELPAQYESIFVGSTLAYYLGAEMVPASTPRLVTDTGFVHELDDPARGFEGEVERVLKQVFFLDCVTRTEGFYPVNLHERNQIEDRVGLDFESLYDQPLEQQLAAYLEVPFSLIEDHLPQWKLSAHAVPLPKHVEMLPFLVNDLAVIQTADPSLCEESQAKTAGVEGFSRNGSFTRSSRSRSSSETPPNPSIIDIEKSDSLEQTWIGEGVPLGASKAMIEAFRNRLERTPKTGDIEITVICNDPDMKEEKDIVDEIYGSRNELPYDVTIKRQTTVDQIHKTLNSDMDFLHYIGHIDSNGFECVNGYFNAESLSHTGVDVFFLNACSSYEQGMHLIEAGSICGIVTLQEVINSGAERIGHTIARLLNRGFPLRIALNIAKNESIMGGHYLVLGDGGIDIAQAESGIPTVCEVINNYNNFRLIFKTFPNGSNGLGSITIPYAGKNDEFFISSGSTGAFAFGPSELINFLNKEIMPIIFNNKLYWSDEINLDILVN